LRAIRQINYIVKYVPARNKVYINRQGPSVLAVYSYRVFTNAEFMLNVSTHFTINDNVKYGIISMLTQGNILPYYLVEST